MRLLADIIIPKDERSGSATDAKVPEFMDFMLMDKETSESSRVQMRGGLAWLDTEMRSRVRQRLRRRHRRAAHSVLDDIAWPKKAKPELAAGVAFFNRFRATSAPASSRAQMGWQDLQYMGNVFNPLERLSARRHAEARRELRGVRREPRPETQLHEGWTARRRLHRQRLQRALPHAGWQGVRDADVLGVWSPNAKNAAAAARYASDLDVGAARPYKSIADMVADPAIDAIWLTGPNHARIENVEEIVDAIERGSGTLKGIACEKPLARNVAEAKEVRAS